MTNPITNPLERRMIEDKALRDAALALVRADVEQLRADLGVRNIGARMVDRVSESASDMLDEAADLADNNKGVLAALVAALLVWLARNPILAMFDGDDEPGDEREDAPEPDNA